MKAHHASDALFQHFDPAHLGTHCEEIGADLDELAKSAQAVGGRVFLRLEFQDRVLAYLSK